MAYKVAVNTELANTIAPRKNASAWLQVFFLSTAQYITVFSVCFCLKTLYLIHIVVSFTLKSWPTTLKLMLMEVDLMHTYSL